MLALCERDHPSKCTLILDILKAPQLSSFILGDSETSVEPAAGSADCRRPQNAGTRAIPCRAVCDVASGNGLIHESRGRSNGRGHAIMRGERSGGAIVSGRGGGESATWFSTILTAGDTAAAASSRQRPLTASPFSLIVVQKPSCMV